ncbi:MAG: hypothetical protein ACYC6Y_20495, partial [Thermoguttaceae bacterium]
QSWRLPALRVQGVHWRESVATITVEHPLRLNDVVSDNGRILQMRPELARKSADGITIQLFSADAQMDVVLGQEWTPPQVEYGVLVEMTGGQISGQQTVRFEVEEGERFQLVGELARSWVVDSVQADRPGVVADWRIERKERAKRQLVVDLATPLAGDSPVQFLVMARRLESTEGKTYASRDLIPVEFVSARLASALVAVQVLEPYRLELNGTEGLTERSVERLSPRERQLIPERFPDTPQNKIFLHDGGDDDLSIRVQQRRSQYSAEIDVSVSVAGRQATESYVLKIDPEAVRLEEIAVELPPRPGVPMRWELSGGDEAKPVTDSPAVPGEGGSNLERWEVRLRPSRSEPFAIRAMRVFAVEDGTAVGLARLPDAARQSGRLSIGVSGGERVRVENRSLAPELASTADTAGAIPPSTFRYDPERLGEAGTPPVVFRVDSSAAALSRGWIWLCQLESRLEVNGEGRHVASYRLESEGAPLVHFVMPPTVGPALLESVEIDGYRVPPDSIKAGDRLQFGLRLRTDRRFHEISICYRTNHAPWAVLQRLEPPLPEPDLPVLKRKWIVWLPPGRQIAYTKGAMADFGRWQGWPAGVLGPLGRDVGAASFDPFAASSWRWEPGVANHGDRRAEPAPSDAAAESSGLEFRELITDRNISAVLDEYSPKSEKFDLLVDAEVVDERGVTPDTKLVLPPGSSPGDRVRRFLNQKGLALATCGRCLVLTDARKAAARGQRYEREGTGVLWRVTDPVWEQEILKAISQASPFLVAASDWTKLPSPTVSPWKANRRPGYEPRDTVGWTVRELALTEGADAPLWIVDRSLFRACLWSCFLLVAILTWAAARRFAFVPVLVIAGLFLGAGYCPEFWSPWLSACFWGSVAGFFLQLATVRRVQQLGRVVARRGVGDPAAVAGLILGCLLTPSVGAENAATSGAVEAGPGSPALILVPRDKDTPTAADEYFVPEAFYTELLKRASQIEAEAPAYLLKEANYYGRLNWQATGEPLTVTEFTAEFTLEILRANAEVVLPLGKTVDNWSLEAAWLDGRRIDDLITWEPGEPTVKLLAPPDPAEWCQLKLQLQPIPGYGINERGFRLDIPPLATSHLKLTVPADAPAIEIATATGRQVREPLSLEADLGPSDRLEVRWQQTGRTSAVRGTRVSELLWMNVTLGGAVVDAQFHFDLGRDFDGVLEVKHDPRLVQRGGYEVEGATLDHVEDADRSPEPQTSSRKRDLDMRQKLSLTEVTGPKVIVRGQFVVREASGVGSLRLPALRTEGFEVTQRWVAATVGPMLQYEQAALGPVAAIGINEFVQTWVGEADPPQVAVDLGGDDASFELSTWPKPPQSTAKWHMALGYGLNDTQLRYQADVDTPQGYLFQHRLTVPPELAIDEVSTAVGGTPLPVRWTRPASEQVVLFYDLPVSGAHSLQIRGRVPGKGERAELVPNIVLQGVAGAPGTIDVYRQHEALVRLESVQGMKEFGPPSDATADDRLGRIVTRWGVDGQGPFSATARIEANRPRLVAREQTLSVRKTPDGWRLDIDCRLEVLSGIVDRIRIETSEAWPGPYEASPEMIQEPTSSQRPELVLRPPQRSQLEFSVSGPLLPRAGGSVSVPRIRLKNTEYRADTNRLVVLPVGPIPAIRWRSSGLTPTSVPTRFVARAPGLAWEAYRVQQDDFVATVRPSPDPAQVCFADIRIGWDRGGEGRGVALFDVEAGDRDSCILRVPRPWNLVAVSSRGVPELPQKTGEQTWSIPLGRTALPQRIEVVFRGRIPLDDREGATIDAFPELDGLPVLRALWTVTGEDGFEVQGALEPVKRQQAALVRLHNVTGLIRRVMDRPGNSLLEEPSWYRGWLGEWASVRRQAEAAVTLASRVTPARAERAEIEALDLDRQSLVDQLGASALWEEVATSAPRIDCGMLWDKAECRGVPQCFYSKDGVSPL